MRKLLSEQEKIAHCTVALKTADRIFSIVVPFKDKLSIEDHREKDDCLNPCYQQTAEGLLLEFWGSRPVAVITPWGQYCFFGWYEFTNCEKGERDVWEEIFPNLQSQLGLVLFKRKSEIEIQTIHGDLFAIASEPSAISETSLPFPIERGYSDFESFEEAVREWKELASQVRTSVSV